MATTRAPYCRAPRAWAIADIRASKCRYAHRLADSAADVRDRKQRRTHGIQLQGIRWRSGRDWRCCCRLHVSVSASTDAFTRAADCSRNSSRRCVWNLRSMGGGVERRRGECATATRNKNGHCNGRGRSLIPSDGRHSRISRSVGNIFQRVDGDWRSAPDRPCWTLEAHRENWTRLLVWTTNAPVVYSRRREAKSRAY